MIHSTKDTQGFANEFTEKLTECTKEHYPVCWEALTKE